MCRQGNRFVTFEMKLPIDAPFWSNATVEREKNKAYRAERKLADWKNAVLVLSIAFGMLALHQCTKPLTQKDAADLKEIGEPPPDPRF